MLPNLLGRTGPLHPENYLVPNVGRAEAVKKPDSSVRHQARPASVWALMMELGARPSSWIGSTRLGCDGLLPASGSAAWVGQPQALCGASSVLTLRSRAHKGS